MLVTVDAPSLACAQAFSAHVVVVGNEKGGSGKSTTAVNVALALLKAGQRVATVDLDSRQSSLTRYIDNRRAWAKRAKLDLELPMHFRVARGEGVRVDENEAAEFGSFARAITDGRAQSRFRGHRHPGGRYLPDPAGALDGGHADHPAQ